MNSVWCFIVYNMTGEELKSLKYGSRERPKHVTNSKTCYKIQKQVRIFQKLVRIFQKHIRIFQKHIRIFQKHIRKLQNSKTS